MDKLIRELDGKNLFITIEKDNENSFYRTTSIIDDNNNVLYKPKDNEMFNVLYQRSNNYILEIINKDNYEAKYIQMKYRNSTNTLDFVVELTSEPKTFYIEKNDTFVLLDTKHNGENKQVLYSIIGKSYVTPKVDFIDRIKDNDKDLFIFEDIHYLKEYDRENHIYGYLDSNGKYLGSIYNYSTDEKIKCNIEKFPNYLEYYMLKNKLNKEFDKQIEKEFGTGISKVKR